MKKEVIVLLLLLMLPVVYAQVPALEHMRLDLEEKTGLTLGHDDIDKVLIVQGSQLNLIEKGTLAALQTSFPALDEAETYGDLLAVLDALDTTNKTIIIIGGPQQNTIAELYAPTLEDRDFREYGAFVALYGTYNGRQIVIFSDARGFNNLDREAADYSILLHWIPRQYVPIAAAGISILLIILADFFSTFFDNALQAIGTRRREYKEEFHGIYIGSFPIRWRELISITVGSSLFGIALAWMFTAGGDNFTHVLFISIIVTLVIFIIQEGLRMFFAWRRGISTEFILYPLGIIVGLISTMLGSLLATPGTWLFREEDQAGPVYYGVMLTIFIMSTIFFVINVVYPSEVMQVILTTASTASFFEFLPISPVNGKDVYAWNKKVWIITVAILAPVYVLINFFL